MFKIAHFNDFDGVFWRDAGDDLLRQLGAFLVKNTRGSDIVCRYGAQEFVVVLGDASLENSLERAEQLRQMAKEMQGNLDERFDQIKLSVGVAAFPEHGSSAADILRSAISALNRADNEGRL